MKRITLAFLLLMASLVGMGLGSRFPISGRELSPPVGIGPSVTVIPTPQAEIPRSLVIPKIGVQADVERVGHDRLGRMDVPQNPANVAWYQFGVKPGERGNAVIDGHLDWVTGPAVFYNLTSLEVGDEIIVVDMANQRHQFLVTAKASYPYNQVPLQEIFGSSSKARLNLITCEGYFDRASQNYSQRVVIYSEAVNS